jgi:hypothetical protein
MKYRDSQFDMPHPGSSDSGCRDFYSTPFTDDSLVSYSLVFAAATFIVFDRTKNRFTEQTSLFGLSCPIIDRIRIIYYSMRSLLDILY